MIKESPDDMSVGTVNYTCYDNDAHCFTVFTEFNLSIISNHTETHNNNIMFLSDFIKATILNDKYSQDRVKRRTQDGGYKVHYTTNSALEDLFSKYPDIYNTYSHIGSNDVHSELNLIEGRYWDKDIPAVSFYNNISQVSRALHQIERLVFHPLHVIKERLIFEVYDDFRYKIVNYSDIKNFSGTSSNTVDLMRKQHLDPNAKAQLDTPKNSLKAQETAQQKGFNSAAQYNNSKIIGDSFNFKEYFKRHYTLLK